MALITTMVVLAIALATAVNAALIPITFVTSLATIAGLFTNTITLGIALATVATAKPQNWTFAGIETREGCGQVLICYAVRDEGDSRVDEKEGYFTGCLGDDPDHHPNILTDGGRELDLCHEFHYEDGRTVCLAKLTELSSGEEMLGLIRKDEGDEFTRSHYPDGIAIWGHGPKPEWETHSPKPYYNPRCNKWH